MRERSRGAAFGVDVDAIDEADIGDGERHLGVDDAAERGSDRGAQRVGAGVGEGGSGVGFGHGGRW
jgi:hypothetical protein